jgi:hypothetical protein
MPRGAIVVVKHLAAMEFEADETPPTNRHIPPKGGTNESEMALTEQAGATGKGPSADAVGIATGVNR